MYMSYEPQPIIYFYFAMFCSNIVNFINILKNYTSTKTTVSNCGPSLRKRFLLSINYVSRQCIILGSCKPFTNSCLLALQHVCCLYFSDDIWLPHFHIQTLLGAHYKLSGKATQNVGTQEVLFVFKGHQNALGWVVIGKDTQWFFFLYMVHFSALPSNCSQKL